MKRIDVTWADILNLFCVCVLWAKIEEKRRQERERNDEDNHADTMNHLQGQRTGVDAEPTLGAVGVPGLCPSSDRGAPPEDPRQINQFHKFQMEEKKVKQDQMTLRTRALFHHFKKQPMGSCSLSACPSLLSVRL